MTQYTRWITRTNAAGYLGQTNWTLPSIDNWPSSGATTPSPSRSDGPAANFEWSFSFGSGFLGTDVLANELYMTAYYVGPPQ